MQYSALINWRGLIDDTTYWKLTLTDHDVTIMDREQLEMIQDGLWLIQQALRAQTTGQLITPQCKLPVRAPIHVQHDPQLMK